MLPLYKISQKIKTQELESKLEIGAKYIQTYGAFKFYLTLWMWVDRRSCTSEKVDWKMLPPSLSTHTIVPWQLGH